VSQFLLIEPAKAQFRNGRGVGSGAYTQMGRRQNWASQINKHHQYYARQNMYNNPATYPGFTFKNPKKQSSSNSTFTHTVTKPVEANPNEIQVYNKNEVIKE
jgi:hypothetical protein